MHVTNTVLCGDIQMVLNANVLIYINCLFLCEYIYLRYSCLTNLHTGEDRFLRVAQLQVLAEQRWVDVLGLMASLPGLMVFLPQPYIPSHKDSHP